MGRHAYFEATALRDLRGSDRKMCSTWRPSSCGSAANWIGDT